MREPIDGFHLDDDRNLFIIPTPVCLLVVFYAILRPSISPWTGPFTTMVTSRCFHLVSLVLINRSPLFPSCSPTCTLYNGLVPPTSPTLPVLLIPTLRSILCCFRSPIFPGFQPFHPTGFHLSFSLTPRSVFKSMLSFFS